MTQASGMARQQLRQRLHILAKKHRMTTAERARQVMAEKKREKRTRAS